MNAHILSGYRVRFQRRWRDLRGARGETFGYALKVFYQHIQGEPLLQAHCNRLRAEEAGAWTRANDLLQNSELTFAGDSEREAAAFGFAFLEALYGKMADKAVDQMQLQNTVFLLANAVRGGVESATDAGNVLVEKYLVPLYSWLDEALDDRMDLLAGLVRYQRWAAFFGYEQLHRVVEDEFAKARLENRNRQIEKLLQSNLFEYLFVDGLSLREITREPLCAVGRPDFMFEVHGDRVVAEVKLFDGEGYNVAGLADGLDQLRSYMVEHGTSAGYLVVFNLYQEGLRCGWSDAHEGIPYLTVDGRCVYVVVVAAVRRGAASGSGAVRPTILSIGDLLRAKV